ncbi:MAG: twin-arginine translocation signal domain-containing protein [Alphaproteobacteria bacterium]|nr:twin-arginine translocation signal domain-containing protein [Alphaproteobacteria bacterium]
MSHLSCCSELAHTESDALSRRGFVRLAALGGAAALFASFKPFAAQAAGNTEALLLSCMDFRLLDEIVKYMDGRSLTNNYDHVVLAGASLGALYEKKPSWGQTFWDHVDVAQQLHHIKKVIVMDHRDCGAYKVFISPDHAKTPKDEFDVHATYLRKLRDEIKKRFPALEVELLLMGLDGKVETVS